MKGLPPHLENRGGCLYIGGIAAAELARTYGTPLYVTDEDRVRENYRTLARAFSSRYSKTRILYAMKANNNLSVLRILQQEGAGIDCSCPEELRLAAKAGYASKDILYTASFPTFGDLQFAASMSVTVNLDDDSLLGELADWAGRIPLSFRIDTEIGAGKFHGLVFSGKESKFGIDVERAKEAYARAKQMGFTKFGLHTMAGSCVLDVNHFVRVTEYLTRAAGKISHYSDVDFTFINIGGGLGIPYEPEEVPVDVDLLAEKVVQSFMDGCDSEGSGRPTLMLEPGRFIVGDSTVLLARVHGVKEKGIRFVGTDAGMNTLLRPALYGAFHEVLACEKLDQTPSILSTVTGQVCENTDVLARERKLPPLYGGDLVAILCAGAYCFSMSSQYNSRPRACEVLVCDGTHEVIRERENLDDLLARQRIPRRLQVQA